MDEKVFWQWKEVFGMWPKAINGPMPVRLTYGAADVETDTKLVRGYDG